MKFTIIPVRRELGLLHHMATPQHLQFLRGHFQSVQVSIPRPKMCFTIKSAGTPPGATSWCWPNDNDNDNDDDDDHHHHQRGLTRGPPVDVDHLRLLPPARHDLRLHQPRHVRLSQWELQAGITGLISSGKVKEQPFDLKVISSSIRHDSWCTM